MALETRSLVNEEWTTRSLNFNTAPGHQCQPDQVKENLLSPDILPELGILTQTVIPSPFVNKILVARLRDSERDDLAFIGNDFVQIKELQADGHLYDIVRKEGFGSRIRNAQVVGSIEEYNKDGIKDEDDDLCLNPTDEPRKTIRRRLPPQNLVLQLCTGDIIFLGIDVDDSGKLRLISRQRRRIEKPTHKLQAGMHLTVDPSSRYIALGCSEGIFAIYALHSRKKMIHQLLKNSSLQFIESGFHLFSDGAILKMVFLHPPADDDKHITLLVIKALMGQTRLFFFHWEAGCDVSKIRPHNPNGILLQEQHKLPLLIITLTIKSSFILVFETTLSIYQGMLEGNPTISNYEMSIIPPLSNFNGIASPLWTAWARPPRLHSTENRDAIFLVREDGLIMYIEIDEEIEGLVSSDHRVSELAENCGPALACLSFYGSDRTQSGDMIITGGDSCEGGVYLLPARQDVNVLERIQNWSPAHDFSTTNYYQYCDPSNSGGGFESQNPRFPRPDRVFACVGKGKSGAVTEFRYGLEAKIGLMSEYDVAMIQSWVFHELLTKDNEQVNETIFLIALGDSSAAMRLASDGTVITELDNDSTKFDLRYRTIVASENGNQIVQTALALPSPIVLSNARTGTLSKFSSHITCLAVILISGIRYSIVGEWHGESNVLNFISLDDESTHTLKIANDFFQCTQMEAIISISAESTDHGNIFLLCGTRDGFLITLEVNKETFAIVKFCCDRIGATSVVITRDEYSVYGHFVVCDSHLFALMPKATHENQTRNSFKAFQINRIWLTDALEPGVQQPKICSIASRPPLQLFGDTRDCLLTTGSHIILASLCSQPKNIPRKFNFGGTPFRIMYSGALRALVVAASVEGKSTILFIDPETGMNLSKPIDQSTKKPVDFISGLGHLHERVFRLFEWIYIKDGKKWNFIIASTSSGRVLIISVDSLGLIQKEIQNSIFRPIKDRPGLKERSKICFYTRYKFWASDPVYSVVGYPDGLLWCAGNMLFCDALDLTDKKFKRVAKYKLPSPAANLEYEDGKIYALTLSDSLEIFKLVTSDSGFIEIVRTHGDPISRPSLGHTIYSSRSPNSVHLVSDKMSKLVGLRPTQNAIMETLGTVFEARLPESVIKFRHCRCRPQWDSIWTPNKAKKPDSSVAGRSYLLGDRLNEMNKSEILGLSITGSLVHFTLLDLASWKFLRFLSILAMRSPKACEFTYRDNINLNPLKSDKLPKFSMHIDGNLLRRCLQERMIEDILEIARDKPNCYERPSRSNLELGTKFSSRLCELLQELHQGNLSVDAGIDVYVEQAYSDLEFFLRPVI